MKTVKSVHVLQVRITFADNVQLSGATSSSLDVSYDQIPGVSGYHILLVNKDGTIQAEQVLNGEQNTQFTFNGLNPSTEYTAVVSAMSNTGEKRFIGSDTASTSGKQYTTSSFS